MDEKYNTQFRKLALDTKGFIMAIVSTEDNEMTHVETVFSGFYNVELLLILREKLTSVINQLITPIELTHDSEFINEIDKFKQTAS